MISLNTHQDAQKAIRWLQDYFKSLKKWVGVVDDACTNMDWTMFEANRASTSLGNGYQDNTQCVMNWISRHYYRNGHDHSLLVYLPLATKSQDDDEVYCYFSLVHHDQAAPEDGIPTFPKDWLTGAAIVDGMRSHSPEQVVPLSEAFTRKAFRSAIAIHVCKIPMFAFGETTISVKEKVEDILRRLGDGSTPPQEA